MRFCRFKAIPNLYFKFIFKYLDLVHISFISTIKIDDLKIVLVSNHYLALLYTSDKSNFHHLEKNSILFTLFHYPSFITQIITILPTTIAEFLSFFHLILYFYS